MVFCSPALTHIHGVMLSSKYFLLNPVLSTWTRSRDTYLSPENAVKT